MSWIEFIQQPKPRGRVTQSWMVRPTGNPTAVIGDVKWYAPWRRYAFMPMPHCVFEQDCLRDLAAFCEERTAERKAQRKLTA